MLLKKKTGLSQFKTFLKNSGLLSEIHQLAHQSIGCWCTDLSTCHSSVLISSVSDYLNQPSSSSFSSDDPLLSIIRAPLSRVKRVTFLVQRVRQSVPVSPQSVPVSPQSDTVSPQSYPVSAQSDCIDPDFDCLRKRINRSIPLSSVVKLSQPSIPKQNTFFSPLPFSPTDWLLPEKISRTLSNRSLSSGVFKSISLGKNSDWLPFICQVVRVIFNKESKRFSLELSDRDSSMRCEVVSQLFEPLNERFISKDSLIYVSCYSISQHFDILPLPEFLPSDKGWDHSVSSLAKPKIKKRIVLISEFFKIL